MIVLALAATTSALAAGVLAAAGMQLRSMDREACRLREQIGRAKGAQYALVPLPVKLRSISERAVGSASRFWEWPRH